MEPFAWTVAINVFIVVYLFFAYIWNAPNDTAFKPLIGLIRPPVRYFGLWHTWAMFAPNPYLSTCWIELHVEFVDGGVLVWRPEYDFGMTRFQKFRRERFRKIGENCRDGEFGYVRSCLCDYVIRQFRMEHGPSRGIKEVRIYHSEEPIIDFKTKPETDLSIKRFLHFRYSVKS